LSLLLQKIWGVVGKVEDVEPKIFWIAVATPSRVQRPFSESRRDFKNFKFFDKDILRNFFINIILADASSGVKLLRP
jgi:hypothetical protein